jgi:PAS domain S-box-containing protein
MDLFHQLFSPDFMPHGFCYMWDPRIVWLNVISDGLIAASYYCIPIILIYFIRQDRSLPFNKIFWMFGGFILACGSTHVMEIWNIWHATYFVAGVMKAITAVLSVLTAAMLISLVPRVMSVPERMHLQEVNRRLEEQIAERKNSDAPIDISLQRWVTRAFIAAAILLLMLGFLSWRMAKQAAKDADWVARTQEVSAGLETTLRHLLDVETGGRGFAATGSSPFLDPYLAGRGAVVQDVRNLRALIVDPAQIGRLNVLEGQAQAQIEVGGEIVAARQITGQAPTVETFARGKHIMDGTRSTVAEMEEAEKRVLTDRAQQSRAARNLNVLVIALGSLAGMLFLVFAGAVVSREIGISARARAQLNALNAELELRVKERTGALQHSLVASEAALKELADQKFALDQHAIVAVTDVHGTISYVNEKFCAISKYSKEELIGQNHRILNSGHHPKEFFADMYRTIAHGEVWRAEVKNRARDGSTYWVDTTVVPFMVEGKPSQYVAIRADITERKRADEEILELHQAMEGRNLELEAQTVELQRTRDGLERRVIERTEQLADANRVLEKSNIELQQFAYIASHDLQSPLRSVSGFVQLLKMEYEEKLDEQARDWIRRTVESIARMQMLIRDLLSYSQVEARSRAFEAVPLREAFQDAVLLLESSIRDSGGEVTCGELPTVPGDRSQLVQLLQNLIGNGLKYHGAAPPHVHISAQAGTRKNEWIVSVRDNGIGIDPKYYDRIFEIFKRLHDQKEYPGTGIGLAVCRRVVERHGGAIWVESEPGRGSNFRFSIPADAATDSLKRTDKTNGHFTFQHQTS